MTVTLEFEPVMKATKGGIFAGMGKYLVSIQGKLAYVEIYGDGSCSFVNWVESLKLLNEEEQNFFKQYNDKIK